MARIQGGIRRFIGAEEIAEMARRYAAGESTTMIARSLGRSRHSVWQHLRDSGVKVRDRSESHVRHTLRHDAFDMLTPDAAYWCGFLFADGSVGRREKGTPEVSVGLSECDLAHLEKLRAFLGSTHAITPMPGRLMAVRAGKNYTSRPAYRYSVRSARLADRLCSLGRYDGPIDRSLARSRDFWRGVVDGDGNVGISCDLASFGLVGSARLLEAFIGFLGDTGSRPLTVRPHKSIYGVHSSGATAERIMDRLYTGAGVVLDRKAARVADVLARALVRPPKPPRWQHRIKVSDAQVAEIWRRYAAGGVTQRVLADEYGTSVQNVSMICRGNSRVAVTSPLAAALVPPAA